MFIILGATGHVGAAVLASLRRDGQPVLAVTHDRDHADPLTHTGAQVAIADIRDPSALRAIFQQGRRAFLLNPPAPVTEDTDAIERATVASILEALEGSGLEKVVAQSTGGARPGDRLGDLNVLWELEQGLQRLGIPAAINRAGFYMSNWDWQLDTARETGELISLFPADLPLPMAAPQDLGQIAAQRLRSPLSDVGIRDVEGPARYSANDVARAFSKALGREVRVTVTPREQWEASFLAQGFSAAAAESYARMTAVALDDLQPSDDPLRGPTTLDAYLQSLRIPPHFPPIPPTRAAPLPG